MTPFARGASWSACPASSGMRATAAALRSYSIRLSSTGLRTRKPTRGLVQSIVAGRVLFCNRAALFAAGT